MRYFFWFILGLFLLSCQTHSPHHTATIIKKNAVRTRTAAKQADKDGAPEGPIPRFFKEIFPAHEPYSRYGNPTEYKVKGHTYEVMRNASGYRSRGLASWYGTKFHKRRTSSGERYDMYALTAAHKTLPLPTYVRVKNLSNGRVAIVKVNDRGPFHHNRIIDLSYGAAAKIGLLPQGTTMVEIEALQAPKQGKLLPTAHYYVQAGAFYSKPLAEALRKKLVRLTPSPVKVDKFKKRYIVKVGPFDNKQATNRLKMALSNHGVKGAFTYVM